MRSEMCIRDRHGVEVKNLKNCLEHLIRNIRHQFHKDIPDYDNECTLQIRAFVQAAHQAESMDAFFRVILKIPRLGNNPAFAKIALYLLREHPIRWTVFANNPCPEKVDSYEEFEKIYEKERFNQVHKIFSVGRSVK